MRAIALLLLLSFTTAAHAEQGTPSPSAPPTSTIVPAKLLAGFGRCDPRIYYPPSAMRAHAQGATTITFTVSEKGAVTNAIVVTSSGNADLDTAAVNCASQWRYNPATKDGAPVESTREATITWKLPAGPERFGPTASERIRCDPDDYPANAVKDKAEKAAAIVFVIDTRGKPSHPAVVSSTGFPDLDSAALDCVNKWSHNALTKNDVAFAAPFAADVDFGSRNFTTVADGEAFVDAGSAVQVGLRIYKCAVATRTPSSEKWATSPPTILEVSVSSGAITDTKIGTTSGSSQMDNRALSCLADAKASGAKWPWFHPTVFIPVFWELDPAIFAAQTPQPTPPPPGRN